MSTLQFPKLIHWKRDARNGYAPAAPFYSSAVTALNHLTAYGGRQVFSRSWCLTTSTTTSASGTTNLARFRFRAKPGATRLTFIVHMGLTDPSATDPRVEIDVTVSGGATTTLDAIHYGLTAASASLVPSTWFYTDRHADIAGEVTYEVLIKAIDYARVLSIVAYEQTDLTVQESTDYYSGLSAAAGVPIYDQYRERLLVGASQMYRRQGGTLWHWGNRGGTANTRTSATKINLIDVTSTGTPTTAHPGVYLNNANRYTASRTTVPYELAVYASCTGSSGFVYLTDTSGVDVATITVTGAASWLTTTVNLPNTDAFYALRFAGDGVNTVSVYAVSLMEWES